MVCQSTKEKKIGLLTFPLLGVDRNLDPAYNLHSQLPSDYLLNSVPNHYSDIDSAGFYGFVDSPGCYYSQLVPSHGSLELSDHYYGSVDPGTLILIHELLGICGS